jgi:hypothetical protein
MNAEQRQALLLDTLATHMDPKCAVLHRTFPDVWRRATSETTGTWRRAASRPTSGGGLRSNQWAGRAIPDRPGRHAHG